MNPLCRRMTANSNVPPALSAGLRLSVLLNLRCAISALFVFLGLIVAGPLHGAVSAIQTATFSRQPTAGGTVTLTLPQATGVGHTLIVGVSFWPLDITNVSDGSGDVFTRGLATSISHDVSGSSIYSNFYYAKSTAGGANSLTLSFSGGSTYLLVSVAEVAGLDPSAPLTQSGFHDSLTPTAAWSSATVTTTAANQYLFSWGATAAGNPSCSGPASGWAIKSQTNDPAGATVCLLDRVVSATGSYQASLTAGSAQNYAMEIVAFQSGSSLPPPVPVLTSVSPNSGTQGQTLSSVILTGSNFQSGATCNFGSGITVNSCAFNSATQLTASIAISSAAAAGAHSVTVTNPGSQSSTLSNGFTVATAGPPPAPALAGVNPNSGAPGQTLTSVILTGSNFQSGATCNFGSGITVNSCAFNSATQLTAGITIGSAATSGARNVTVANADGQSSTLSNAFSVTAAAPAISLIQKATFSRQPTAGGSVSLTLPQATGVGHTLIVGVTFWPQDVTSITDGSGDTFTRGLAAAIGHEVYGSVTFTNFFYAKSTAGGANSLTLNFSGGSTYLLVAVAEVAGLNSSSPFDQSRYHESLTPTTAWSSAPVTTSGTNEYLFSWGGTTSATVACSSPASGWTIESSNNDSSGATVCLLDRIVSAIGPYQAALTASPAEDYAMEIVSFQSGSSPPPPPPPAPTLASLNPNSGAEGQTLSLILNGSNFQSGAVCLFGAGVTVNSCTFNSATQLTANISITAKASVGAYDVTVTNPDGQANTLTNGFTVTAASPAPAPILNSVNPNSGAPGQTLASVILTGSNFQSGATCSFGTGITVNSCTFNSATQFTASIAISTSATAGAHNVTVTNPGSQSSTLTNGFTVTAAGPAPAPILSSINPNSGAPGQTLASVILTGSNFQSGATCSFGSDITVNSCAFNSATQLTASIAISSSASVGARDVTVTNPGNVSSTLSSAFSVTALPAISVIQKATFSRQPTAGGTVTLTLPQPTGAGHTLIVGVSFWPLDIIGISDASGDIFTRGLATPIAHQVSGSVTFTNFYYVKVTGGGASSLTLNFSGGSTYLLVAVAEVAGLNTSTPLDQSGFHESLTPTTAWSSATVTTTSANEYLFSWGATVTANPACSSPASGWTIESQTNDPSGATVCLLDRIVSATGPYQASVSASSAQDYAMEIVTFH